MDSFAITDLLKKIKSANKIHLVKAFCIILLERRNYPMSKFKQINNLIKKPNFLKYLCKNVECILSLIKKNRPTFEESLISTSVIEAANKSLKNNSNWKKINF